MVTVDMRPPGLGTPLLEAVLARDAADRIQGVSRPEGQSPNSQERAHLVDLVQTSSFGVANRGLTVRSAHPKEARYASPAPRFPDEDEPDDEQPGVSIRPLSHHDLDAILGGLEADRDSLLAGTTANRPVVAPRVRATVGRPDASAEVAYQARRAVELAAWLRGLPWRATLILGVGVVVGLLAPRLGLLAGVAAAGIAGWVLRFAPPRRPGRGGAAPSGSAAPPACWAGWSGMAGRCCTTWPSQAPGPTSTTL
jgi:hypothetical protein